jgi:transcriptional regulator with XRE-family HTH domain
MEVANAAELLRRARLHRGISQEALAIRAGLTQADIAEIESDQTSPTVGVLTELLHLLGDQLVLAAATRETGIDLTLNQSNLELSVEQRVEKGLGFADLSAGIAEAMLRVSAVRSDSARCSTRSMTLRSTSLS